MKRIVIIAASILALLLAAVLALPFLIDPNSFRPMLESRLSGALGREVRLGNLKLSILSGSVTASDLSIADDPAFSREPFLKAGSLAIGVELWPLIASRRLHVTGIAIDRPAIALLQAPSGEWNFSTLGGTAPAKAPEPASEPGSKHPLDLSVSLVKIAGGRFSLGQTGGHQKPLVLDPANLEVRDFSAAAAFPFSFSATVQGGGTIQLAGKAGPLALADITATPLTGTLTVDKLDLAATGLTQNAPAISALTSFQASFGSTGETARVEGKLRAEHLRLDKEGKPAAKPLEFAFTVEHNLRRRSGQLRPGEIHIGAAVIRLTGTYAMGSQATVLHLALDGPNMPVPELAAMLPAMGISLPNGSSLEGGTASVKFAVDGPLDRVTAAGSLSLDQTKLAGFDLGRKMAAVEAISGIHTGSSTEIRTLAATLRFTPEGTVAESLQLVVPSIGSVEGSGTVNPAHILDLKMRATVQTSGLLASVGGTPIPFTVQGPVTDPVIRPDMKSFAKGRLQQFKSDPAGKAGSLLKGLFGGKKQ